MRKFTIGDVTQFEERIESEKGLWGEKVFEATTFFKVTKLFTIEGFVVDDWGRWFRVFKDLIEVDNRDTDTIRNVSLFAGLDEFWKTRTLKPESLRNNFDTIEAQMNVSMQKFEEEMQQMYEEEMLSSEE